MRCFLRKNGRESWWESLSLWEETWPDGEHRDPSSLSAECLFGCGVFEKVLHFACFTCVVTKFSRGRENGLGGSKCRSQQLHLVPCSFPQSLAVFSGSRARQGKQGTLSYTPHSGKHSVTRAPCHEEAGVPLGFLRKKAAFRCALNSIVRRLASPLLQHQRHASHSVVIPTQNCSHISTVHICTVACCLPCTTAGEIDHRVKGRGCPASRLADALSQPAEVPRPRI